MNPLPSIPVCLLVLTSAAQAAPTTLSGEWYGGTIYARSAYTLEGFQQVGSDAERLLLRPDGTYELSTLSKTATPETFGWSGRMISCEKISIRWETGKYVVQGTVLTLRPGAARGVSLATPQSLNSGCTRSSGLPFTSTDLKARTYTWKVTGVTLTLTSAQDRAVVRRATPEELKRANAPAAPTPAPHATPAPVSAPRSPAAPPVRTDGSGKWVGRFTSSSGAPLDVKLNMEDDRLGLQGMVLSADDRWLGTVEGDYRAGALILTLRMPGDTILILRATGRFDGDRYVGQFQATTEDGQALSGGDLQLAREPLPLRQR